LDADVVLTEPQRTAAIAAAVHVAGRLRDPEFVAAAARRASAQSQFPSFNHWMPPSVAQGNAGLAVLWAFLDRADPTDGWDLVGKAHLEIAGRAAESGVGVGTGFFSGLSGLAFAAWQLSRDGLRYQRLLATLDAAVAQETLGLAARIRSSGSSGVSVGDFDVISGLSGIGAYLLCRHDQPAIGGALANAADALTALIVRDESLPAWHTPARLLYDDIARQSYPSGNLNCGLAHGAPGMLAFLSLVRSCGLPLARLDEAIVVIADWLSANRLDDEWGVNWPTAVPLEEVESAADSQLRPRERSDWTGGPSRSAWCYGSPGVARSLWLAGQALDRPDYRDLAVSAMEAVFRRPVPARMIDSPTFCHGVAGLLAIALRFARETRSPLLVMESQKLVTQLLDAFQPDSLLGYRNLEYGGNQIDQPGLLDGAAGVALVLLTAATAVEPTWDRAFLLA
jgi:lantibiotic biosynthesis protein